MAYEQILQKKHTLWRVVGVALIGATIGFFLPSFFSLQRASAKEDNGGATESCTGTSGNLEGYITTDNVGPIYLSKESWNNDNPSKPSNVDFYVNYDTERKMWSGRGWNEEVGWVNFDYDQQNKLARFIAPGKEYDRTHDSDPNNDEPVEWGNWRGIADLSSVYYSVQDGHFMGNARDIDSSTGEGDSDEPVGSGNWSFENVSLVKPDCPEQINLLVNLKSRYHQKECPIKEKSLIIQWTSEGVHDCKSIAGPWELISRPIQNTGRNVHNTSDIEARANFTIQCTGDYTGANVVKTATASCGENGDGGEGDEPCTGPDCPLIVPKLIEA